MQKRRSGRASTKTSIGDEIAHLRGLDLKGLRSRWQSVFQRLPPDRLPGHLLFAIIAYRVQTDRLGDLDHETTQVLDRTDAKDTGTTMSSRLVSLDQKRTELTPGTVLVREWDRHIQRVMVMADGFAWNGQTYDSLSKVAFATTGTKWNGPRFKKPFDPWVENHDNQTLLRSAAFDELESATEVRDRGVAYIDRLNGAMALSRDAGPLHFAGVTQFMPDGTRHRP